MTEPLFDISSQAFKDDPHPTLQKMNEAGPLVRMKMPVVGRIGVVTTYRAVNEFLRDHDRFVQDPKNAGRKQNPAMRWWMPGLFRVLSQQMLNKDEPDHRRLRDLVEQAFLRHSVEAMRDRVRELADQAIDEAVQKSAADGTVDIHDHFSRQFPLAVICELLGLPGEDRPKFSRWAGRFSSVGSAIGLLRVLPGLYKLRGYLQQQFRACRQRPRPGMLSALAEAEHEGDRLSEDELTAMGFLLLIAGHETTTHLISTGLLALLEHPQQKAALMSDWSLGESAVDEMLRFGSPVQITKPRMVAQDMEWHGHRLKQSEMIVALLAAANCDPDEFEDPRRFDIRRHPNRHVEFGTGIHICLGLKLAVLEVRTAMERLLTRFPDLELAVPRTAIRWTKRIGLRSMTALPIKLNA